MNKNFSDRGFVTIIILAVAMVVFLFFDSSLIQSYNAAITTDNIYWLDLIANIFSDEGFLLILLIVIPVVAMIFDKKKRNFFIYYCGSIAVSFLISLLLKSLIARPRPNVLENFFPLIVESSYSFPSSHVAFVAAALPFIYRLYPKFRIPVITLTVLVGWSRFHLGVHYLSDIFAGAVLGLLTGYAVYSLKQQKINFLNNELKRQAFHIIAGITIVFIIYIYRSEIDVVKYVISIITILGVIVSLVQRRYKLPIITWFLKNFDRPGMLPGMGAITFFIGISLTLWLFNDYRIALASILIMTLGDGFATIIGSMSNYTLQKGKTIEGTIAGMAAGIIGALMFVSIWQAVLGSVIAMLFEALGTRYVKIDDNILVPLVAGAVMSLI